jgi:hypothetical protein
MSITTTSRTSFGFQGNIITSRIVNFLYLPKRDSIFFPKTNLYRREIRHTRSYVWFIVLTMWEITRFCFRSTQRWKPHLLLRWHHGTLSTFNTRTY